jgi:hypothetical protein
MDSSRSLRWRFRPALLLVLTIVLFGAPAAYGDAAFRSSPDDEERGVRDRRLPYAVSPPAPFQRAIAQGTRTNEGLPGDAYWQNRSRYVISARLLPEDRRIEGEVTISYENRSPDTLRVVHIELAQNVHAEGVVRNRPVEVTGGVDVRRVAVTGQTLDERGGAGARYTVSGTNMAVVLPDALAPGGTVDIETDWSFSIPRAGAGGRMGHSRDNLFFLAYWYPTIQVYDDVEGWHTDPFLGGSEFYHGFGDYDVTIEAPPGWVLAATGELQNPEDVLAPAIVQRMRRAYGSDEPVQVIGPSDFGEAGTRSSPDGRLRWNFSATNVRDFAFSATRESIWEAARTPIGDRNGDGQVEYAHINTFYRGSAPRWAQVTRYQQHALSFLSEYTGVPYPWPQMTAVEGAGIIGGGMEYPMITLMGDYNAAGDHALYAVTAHELGHMWIPMIVGTNERRYSWLDEGSTSFVDNQAQADFSPGMNYELQDRMTYVHVARLNIEGEIMRRSNYHYNSLAYGVASYAKPSTLLVALRGLLGPDTFQEAYRAFVREWAFRHPYPNDFFRTFDRVSGQPLDWFWSSYYHETWTLDQAVTDVRADNGVATITVENLGLAPMPARLQITYSDGEVLREEIPVDVWLEGATTATISVPADAALARVEIDPELHFPDVDRTNNVWTP